MNRREQVLVAVCVVFVGGSVWYALSGTPGAKTNLVSYTEANRRKGEARANARKLTEDQAQIVPKIKARAYRKSPEDLVPIVVGNLQTTAEKAGIHLREVRPLRARLVTDESDPATAAASGSKSNRSSGKHEVLGARVPIEVRFRAPFQPNVVKFLYEVETPAGKMVIDKISITSADARFKTVEVAAQISVFTQSSAGASGADTGDTTDGTTNKG